MQAQSIVMLIDKADGVAEAGQVSDLRQVIGRTLDKARWRLVVCDSVESAQDHFQVSSVGGLVPELVVLNVDVQRGWPFCSTLKKNFASVPVIVVSHRLAKEVFNNHQKLDTRADAYHRLPEELDGLEISLGYFASHKSETGHDEEESSPRVKARKGARVAVPTGVLQQLEATVAEQARALEDARRQIEALEAERDAVADKNRRQVLELMALAPASGIEGSSETQALRERIALLEAQAINATIREDELKQARTALQAARADIARLQERPATEQVVVGLQAELATARAGEERLQQELDRLAVEVAALRTERDQLVQRQASIQAPRVSSPGMARPAVAALEEAREEARREAVEAADQLAKASVQLASLATELKTSHERRLQAEEALRKAEVRASELEQLLAARGPSSAGELGERLLRAEERAEAAERSFSAAAERIEELQVLAQARAGEIDRISNEKKSIDDALAMSRRLMREYASDAARKAEELKVDQARTRDLEARLQAAEGRVAELTQTLDFDRSLVESLEKELAELKAGATGQQTVDAELTAQLAAREAEIARLGGQIAELVEAIEVREQALAERLAESQRNAQLAISFNRELEQVKVARALLQNDLEQATAARDEARRELAQAQEAEKVWKAELSELRAALDGAQTGLKALEVARDAALSELERKSSAHQSLLDEHAELTQRHATHSEAHVALTREHAELMANQAELAEELDGLRDRHARLMGAHEQHLAEIGGRFAALREYARACEARLVEAEAARALVESRVELLLAEVRAAILRGDVPPSMELPPRPATLLPPADEGADLVASPASGDTVEPLGPAESIESAGAT